MSEREYAHEPVLLQEVLSLLVEDRDGLYLDATLGAGGHAEAVLRSLSCEGRLLGMDLDPEALSLSSERLKEFGGRFRCVQGNFKDIARILQNEGFFPLAGALFDLGVSSLQLDEPSRGFAFQREGPLDMRLDPANPLTASRIVNEWPTEQIELLLREYGEEREAPRIARWIVEARSKEPIETTGGLASLIEARVPRSGGIHPATRTFQALRIAVNGELENLTRGLGDVLPMLRSGGRIAAISFHSLEDRIIKNVFRSFTGNGTCRGLSDGPLTPRQEEVERNPRSRSAKLRAVEKL
ncbi:MAG: 16S rRNA (cytosine(1402)-N(4))-methyltransferase RsmH [Elusimicrobia bacterium]|nr:16S rRNA (cytosine(1402)-N(4))-methyltransferase RsmH [Elusimicrobiota bacterium]